MFFARKNHVSRDLKVKVSEDQTEAEVVLPGFAFGDHKRFGKNLLLFCSKRALTYQLTIFSETYMK